MKSAFYHLLSICCLVSSITIFGTVQLESQQASESTIKLARMFAYDLTNLNVLPYLQPMVEAVNATSNSRFFNQAFVPHSVDKPYIRFGLHGMLGIVRDDQKTFKPTLPNAPLDLLTLSKYMSYNPLTQAVTILDTAGLLYYALKVVAFNGLQDGSIKPPASSATVLGNSDKDSLFNLPHSAILNEVHNMKFPGSNTNIYDLLPLSMQKQIDSTIGQFPEQFPLPPGGNISTIAAGVPQFEIGSWMGTEALIRFIPPVDLGSNIGKFSFWGFGLKHSISQYFLKDPNAPAEERSFDLAVQAVYQGTHLTNTIGLTEAQLTSNSTMWDINLQASKSFAGILDVYTGFSLEFININAQYKFTLPRSVQYALHMIPNPDSDPVDTVAQIANIKLKDTNFKWIIGAAKQFGIFNIFIDYNISKFNIFTGGVEVRL